MPSTFDLDKLLDLKVNKYAFSSATMKRARQLVDDAKLNDGLRKRAERIAVMSLRDMLEGKFKIEGFKEED